VSEPIRKTVDIVREATQCPTCGQRFGRDARFCPFDGVTLGPATYDPLQDPLLGTAIEGRYEVLELLGEGGTGRVYKVRHSALGRLFAMKILRRDLACDEVIAARFIQEARATARVRHPHVVEITDYGSLPEGTPFFVTELLVGQTLRGTIKSHGAVPLSRAVEVVKQIAGALAAAHGVGIIHRDLKPDNIFLTSGPTGATDVRVVDFGAAKVAGASRLTRDGVVYGTPHYMSPEQASGQALDHRSDIYSLGVIMYEMFTGRVPFEADTYMGVLTQHMFVQPVPPSRVVGTSASLGAFEQITLACLSKRAEDRYASMRALAADIERAWSSFGQSQMSRFEPNRGASGEGRAGGFDSGTRFGGDGLDDGSLSMDQYLLPGTRVPWRWIACGAVVVATLIGATVWLKRDVPKAASASRPEPAMGPSQSRPSGSGQAASTQGAPLVLTPLATAAPSASAAAAAPVVGTSPASTYRAAPRRGAPSPKLDDIGDPFAVRR
jgi:eukaryotic-like serine/threonine-protein kinase